MATATLRPLQPAARTAVIASADRSFRQRVREALTGLRWQVREATGGAEALAHLDEAPAETLILDTWLPDLEIREFVAEFEKLHPVMDLVTVEELPNRSNAVRNPRRNEVLFALRRGQDSDGPAWNGAADVPQQSQRIAPTDAGRAQNDANLWKAGEVLRAPADISCIDAACRLPEFVGHHPSILKMSRRIRLVAPHRTPVLVEGPTGSGKELVARAIHRLSPRSSRPFVALNCAAIPEALLEAELFGHSRGAFTGAVKGRVGRIEAAQGGTLFLDEIGEMPLALQSKMLRFVESGELQRVGENDPVRVDVRIIAATHRPLAQMAALGAFRADLYYRLAVFLVRTPSLDERQDDLPALAAHFLARQGERAPLKTLSADAMQVLRLHKWAGNVRELEHVLERAVILAEDRPVIGAEEIEFGDQEAAF